MLAAVGHAVAVNPDRELARTARANEWEIVNFSNRVPLRERVDMSPAALGIGSLAVAGGAAAAGAGYWLWRERTKPAPPPKSWFDALVTRGAPSWRLRLPAR